MAKFYIEKVIASGSGKEDAIVSFGAGLNIIQGYSDTGKTCILKCINFIFGDSEVPFDASTGYSHVTMVVMTPNGRITFDRSVGKNKIQVSSLDSNIESGTYDIAYKKNQKNPVINSLWLMLIGIEEEHLIVSNKHFEKKRLTWKNLMRMLYINEDDIAQSESIIEPVQYVEKTLFLSALLFLISGRDFSETDAQTKKEIRVAQKKAVEDYVNRKIKDASERKKELLAQLTAFENVDIEKEMESIVETLEKTEASITQAVNESKELLGQIMQTEKKAAECDVLYSRYQSLKSQYTADIKRLTFIANGEVGMQRVPQSTKCPFCEGEITARERKSYMETARAELVRIVSQLEGLGEAEADVKNEKVAIQEELAGLKAKRANVELLINEQLRPKANELSRSLQGYRAYVQLKNEISVIGKFADAWTTDLRQLPYDEESDALEYHPKEYFDDDFKKTMDEYAKDILAECNYENLTTARFNLQDFDIEVNGGKKATNHGKGYRAFLNTVVALMFRKYLANKAKYKPGLLIIDTPLLGLDQGVDDAAPESMRTALFKYFMNNQSEGQLIVVENLDHIPKLDYEASGANVITFTKGRFEGRYGFLADVR